MRVLLILVSIICKHMKFYVGIILIIIGIVMALTGVGDYIRVMCVTPPHAFDEASSVYVDCAKQRAPLVNTLIYGGSAMSFFGVCLFVYAVRKPSLRSRQ
ncbi:protein of unknown function [Nitrosotalea devaniterrae]|uniref:Uncharacterized protein n=1 Tax=Nitrosotalea devaniterrae TaxID=1078905 RepID=A0A128A214_9ARCH|nr:protein of unknown function [Candidatus Nitrosotalea devanaterra]